MKQSGERHKILYNFNSLKIFIMREWKIHHYFLPVSHFFIIKERNLIKIYYLCKKFRCLLIVYRRTIREFINVVKINWIDDYTREIVVLNVDGSSPSGHPKRRHRRKAMSFFVSRLQGTLQSKSLQVKYLQGFFFSVTPYFDGTLMEHLTFDL